METSGLHFQLISHIAGQMIAAKLNEIEPYHLCFFNGSIEVHNASHDYHPHPVFHRFTAKQTHAGCSHTELCKITAKLLNFFQENPECLKQFKP